MKLPNLLATRRGRLVAFFFLYLSEGIPYGFTATAVTTQMRRQGLEPAVIGAFVGSLYLPWAIKWAFGPVVDVLAIDRWGRRRGWILITQVLMIATLLAAMPVSFTEHLGLFTAIVFLVNVFAATQDVAIDALAVNVLSDDERGLANGLMFGGQYLGIAVGGSGVLLLTSTMGFSSTFLVVGAAIAAITLAVTLPMRELAGPPRAARVGSALRGILVEMAQFASGAGQAFIGSRAALVAVFVALLPMGAMALGLALQSSLAVELGMSDAEIGRLTLMSTLLSGGFCVLGGWLSDRFGRRRTLALFIAAMSLPTIALAIAMHQHGWILPVSPQAPSRPVPPAELITIFRTVLLTYASFQGLMYGIGTAIFMDVTTPRVAATQFTAYMAMTNFATSYSATWQGQALQRWGYPVTLSIDAVFGLVGLALLPLMGAMRRRPREGPVATVPEGVLP
jgi:PAT family beta-lactamase induction signal transducer AmpG